MANFHITSIHHAAHVRCRHQFSTLFRGPRRALPTLRPALSCIRARTRHTQSRTDAHAHKHTPHSRNNTRIYIPLYVVQYRICHTRKARTKSIRFAHRVKLKIAHSRLTNKHTFGISHTHARPHNMLLRDLRHTRAHTHGNTTAMSLCSVLAAQTANKRQGGMVFLAHNDRHRGFSHAHNTPSRTHERSAPRSVSRVKSPVCGGRECVRPLRIFKAN